MSASTKSPRAFGAYLGLLLSGGLFALTLGMTAVTAAAGDLLRGGYTNSTSQAANPTSFTPASVSRARANMTDELARATQAVQAVLTMQSAARKIAVAKTSPGVNPDSPTGAALPVVPNGGNVLVANGLYPVGGVTAAGSGYAVPTGWTGVKALNESQTRGGTTVTVVQNAEDAVLTWSSFNIGKNVTLDFNQSAGGANVGDWIAFNMVEGATVAPSQILGSIKAQGQVYVINQNGIIFGGASQVNVHALVASSLPINDNLAPVNAGVVSRGLLNNPDDQFLFSQLSIAAGTLGPTPAFTPTAGPLANGEDGNVTVEAGAQITAPANADNTGGRVALIGPNVTNAGTISTPDGQTILAAGDQVGFLASTAATLRGLNVYVGAVTEATGDGEAKNTGIIEAARGDVTMAGKDVEQLGVIASTTSVSLNGRVDLDAAYGAVVTPNSGNSGADLISPTLSGMVTLGPDSETSILPELSSAETVVGTTLALASTINIEGETIHFATDSQILAPNANVTVSAGGWYQGSTSLPATLIPNGGQIYFDAGASIDVAGSIVSAPVSQNIVSAELLGPQLANSPLQVNEVLYGQTVEVDAREAGIYNGVEWEGTPLANVAGYIDLIQLPVGELTTAGGSVSLSAGGSVVMQPGSEINVSGGAINYQGGMVKTTYLLSGGHIIPIADATPNLVYQGVLGTYTVDYAKWGISNTYTTPLVGGAVYQESYSEGGNGGSITISAPSMALDGELLGQTSVGPRQLVVPPTASSLSISFQNDTAAGVAESPTPPHIYFGTDTALPEVEAFAVDASGNPLALPADRQAEVILSPELLTQDGFGSLAVNNGDGDVTVPAGVALTAAPFGSISMSAANLTIEGSITAPDGSLSFTVYDYSPYSTTDGVVSADATRGHFVLGAGASLSTAGLIIDNEEFSPTANTQEVATGGGSIGINSYSADLAAGSSINVSGGAVAGPKGALTYGNGGAVAINAGEDPNGNVVLVGGKLTLDAALTGYSGSKGGALSIEATAIQIGGGTPENANTLQLEPSFFSQGGFASFSLTGIGISVGNSATDVLPGIVIEPGTVISPVVESWLGAANALAAGGVTLRPVLLPEAQRTPVSLSFFTPGVYNDTTNALVTRGDFVMGAGAVITTDPLGSVSINSGGASTSSFFTTTVLGSIIAPGGTISIKGGGNSDDIFSVGQAGAAPLATVYIGPDAALSTAGTTVLTPDIYGYPTGSVLPGGTISISGNIVAAAGAVLNVSGASGVLYLPESETALGAQGAGSFLGTPVAPYRVNSNGGYIFLTGGQELFTDVTLIGTAGGASATGGSLTVTSGDYTPEFGTPPGPASATLVVTQSGSTIPTPTRIGQAVMGINGQAFSPTGGGHIAVESFQGGGFDNITLAGNVQFNGRVEVSAGGELSVGNGGVIIAQGAVSLSAPYVVLGMPFAGPLTPTEQEASPFGGGTVTVGLAGGGTGSLTVTADLIDIGNLSLQDIANVSLNAPNGDIRGDGTLDVEGNVTLTAGQIYPPTESVFTIAAYNYNGAVEVASSQVGSNTVTLASATRPTDFVAGLTTLLGATVQSIDGDTVTLASAANATVSAPTEEAFVTEGSVTIKGAGARDLPLSAGGTLNIYASEINQDGVLVAPMGTINLGWNGTSAVPDPITGTAVDLTRRVTLGAGSITSVSAVDPLTGQALIIPYGSNATGTEWIDPEGNNITAGGVPEKAINITGGTVKDEGGSVIDLKGGGDLTSYEFVSGEHGTTDFLDPGVKWAGLSYSTGQLVSYNGSTWIALQQTTTQAPAINQYWSQIPTSYAVIPGYQSSFAPYAPFNSGVGDPGYVSANLQVGEQVGEQVYLAAGSGLAAGVYTLLPARYALLPGAYLVTPETGTPAAGQTLPDGSNLVSGYQFNGLSNPGGLPGPLISLFQVDSQAVVKSRGEYVTFTANGFLSQGAVANKAAVPLLPIDAGQLNIDVGTALELQGAVEEQAPSGGVAGFVDINSSSDIEITAAGSNGGSEPGTLTISASELSSIGAGNLLIGGYTTTGADGTTLTVDTNNVTVDGGATLSGGDIILVANYGVTVKQGAEIVAVGAQGGRAQTLLIQDDDSLNGVGDTLGFAQGGVPIAFAQGTPGNDKLTATVAVTVTTADGGTATHAAGSAFTLSPGSTVTLSAPGTIGFAGGTGGPIAVTLSDGALLQASSGAAATIVRSGVAGLTGEENGGTSETVDLEVEGGTKITGASINLNSTYGESLGTAESSAEISGKSISVGAGEISIQLTNAGSLQAGTEGLVLTQGQLQNLKAGKALSLLSYSSMDIYGTTGAGGAVSGVGSLTLTADEIDGVNQGGGTATFDAGTITLNGEAGTAQQAGQATDGSLAFTASGVIHLGGEGLTIDCNVELNGAGGIIADGSGIADTASDLVVEGNLGLTAPLITGAAGAREVITSNGAGGVTITGASTKATVTGGLGTNLSITGASVADNGSIAAPSGEIALVATSGDVVVGGAGAASLNAGGTAKVLVDQTKYTGGGTIALTANEGSVDVGTEAMVNVAAQTGGGNSGTLAINAPDGSVSLLGTLIGGKAGAKGEAGTFSLDVGSIPAVTVEGQTYAQGSLDAIDAILDAGLFTQSITIRDRSDGNVTLDGAVTADAYNVSVDNGSIDIAGTINASDVAATNASGNPISIGGTINLTAEGSVTLENGAVLNVSGQNFSNAGKGGAVTLSAGAEVNGNVNPNGWVNVKAGSTINLSVADSAKVAALVAAGENPQNTNYANDFAGTLLIRAPQYAGAAATLVQVDPIMGTIVGAAEATSGNSTPLAVPDASSIVVEGYKVYNVNAYSSTGVITPALQTQIYNDGVAFLGANGVTTANYTSLMSTLVGSNAELGTALTAQGLTFNIETGAEIVNLTGDLVLGSSTPNSGANDWNLATDRFGPNGTAGQLTLRAAGNLVFYNSLSDGFASAQYNATLLPQNTALPANIQSWSYTLTAGADMSAAASGEVVAGAGSLELGINDPNPIASTSGVNATTASALAGGSYYQVIRTGAGNIDISAGANVDLLNQFATIYTAGTQVEDATMGGAFSVPILDESENSAAGLGSKTSVGYAAQYSEAGGNVTIAAEGDIEHLTQDGNGNLIMDSESELPDNWLYRRGDVVATGPNTGEFDSNTKIKGKAGGDPSESTTWWVDFSNFFEGVGALGGGNVTMTAGGNIANVDAVVPTNARMPGIGATGNLAPNAGSLVELGGGNLLVRAGNDINAGVYYVENGQGTLIAGNQITTNSTRAPDGGESAALGDIETPEQSWLPTTLFVGNGSFDITAGGDVLLGPVANPFLLPEGLNNSVWYKTYFSTYGLNDKVDVTSLGGNITFREYAGVANNPDAPILQVWLQNTDFLYDVTAELATRAYYQPWLRLNETLLSPFGTAAEMMPATLLATAFSGNINIAGNLLLSPSPVGTINLAASGSINGFQSLGEVVGTTNWISATIDISDSDPASIPWIASPIGYQEEPGVGTVAGQAEKTNVTTFLDGISNLFDATNTGPAGVLETEQQLHDTNILHGGDPTPVELDAVTGNIADLELYSPTETRVIAGGDMIDIGFYLQNNTANAISVVSAGGEIEVYDPTSPARQPALEPDNQIHGPVIGGDIQIAGPGTLEVLAGTELNLGGQGPGGPTNTTGDGIASIGSTLNPALGHFAGGADIVAAAGIGSSAGLGESELDFTAFITQVINGPGGTAYLGELSEMTSGPTPENASAFKKLTGPEQDLLALDVFFLALRDAGRDHNVPSSSGYGNYDAGLTAIEALFPKAGPGGNIDVTARDIVTEGGGNISLLAPNGQVTVGLNSSVGNDVTNLGIVTQAGGNISIFTSGDVNVGTSRIFTLLGGNEIIWSSEGNIDAGASSKTVQSAPPTRVLVDSQSGNVQTDLAGLATGGGIGVLASVANVPAGNVDLIAPTGVVNAGEAGIRATGNLNIAAVEVLNAGNIAAGGASTGLPPPVVGPNIAGLAAASSVAGSENGAAATVAAQQTTAQPEGNDDSIITVQVLGYGGAEGDDVTE